MVGTEDRQDILILRQEDGLDIIIVAIDEFLLW